MSASAPVPTLANYQTRLPSFEGPLDVLLRLIERHQLEITDVSLVQVTDQFLAHVEQLAETTPHDIAEFTMVGTRLILLKSRSLLPRPPANDEEKEPDPDELVQQLQAYKRLKQVAHQLGKRRESDLESFGPSISGAIRRPKHTAPLRLAQYDPSVLLRSLRRRLSTVPQAMQTIRQRRIVSIKEMISRIAELATRAGSLRFSTITDEYVSRTEVATAFLAVLVLIRGRSLDASQDGLFGEIELSTSEADTSHVDLDDAGAAFLN
ncbi:MAG TPA: segregation/condensation protein A [Thermomicrobiales bacterium]|nr:segregation/condensation protein A [Thermomicrobiales bacterium]